MNLSNLSFCPDGSASFLSFFDLSIAPPLLFYAYIPIFLLSLFVGSFIWNKSNDNLAGRYLAYITLAFAAWIFLILFQWTAAYLEVVHLAWQLLVIPEVLIYLFSIYFCFAYLFRREMPKYFSYVLSGIYLVSVMLMPTLLNVHSFDFYNCEGIVGRLWDAIYVFELASLAVICMIAFESLSKAKSSTEKVRSILMPLGIIVFLGIFWVSNYFGELTKTYEINLVGPIGMALFLVVLSYMIVRFKTFNIKILGTQVLVVGVWFLVFALLFIQRIEFIQLVVVATLVLLLAIGYFLIESVKREVSLREQLQVANEGQANLIHIINHQIKGYLAKSRNIFSELLTDSDYGPIPEPAKPMLNEGLNSLTEGVSFVTDFLNASNIEKGVYKYELAPFDLKKIVEETYITQKKAAEGKGLAYSLNIEEGDYNLIGDKNELGQAVRNLIDNSIKYTPSGSMIVELARYGDKILFSVKDTGVGISDELKPKLFTKGGRDKDSQKININSTGFGLAFVKGVAEAHKGRVWAESPGVGKGSTFYMELPVAS